MKFNGINYYKKPDGYWQSGNKHNDRYLHRIVWSHHNGKIPATHCIHHIDHDRGNNDISNLQLMTFSEHATYHSKVRMPKGSEEAKNHMASIRDKASEWHGSPEGIEWHKKHGKQTWENRESETHLCVQCDKEYALLKGTRKKGYCSPACQSQARRDSGIDDEERNCVICDKPFTTNKNRPKKTCGSQCHVECRKRTIAFSSRQL